MLCFFGSEKKISGSFAPVHACLCTPPGGSPLRPAWKMPLPQLTSTAPMQPGLGSCSLYLIHSSRAVTLLKCPPDTKVILQVKSSTNSPPSPSSLPPPLSFLYLSHQHPIASAPKGLNLFGRACSLLLKAQTSLKGT